MLLVACEESQEVCKAFRELGHEAFSCDLQKCSGEHPEWHIVADCRDLITECCWISSRDPDIPDEMFGTFKTQDGKRHNLPARWDMIIAHPPCTYLSNAGARWLYAGKTLNEERYRRGLAAKELFMLLLNAKCDRICVENPVPSRIYELPSYTQVVQPYEYGHPYSKKTCLWLKGLPLLVPTEVVEDYSPFVSSGSYTKTHDPKYKGASRKGGSARSRSKTFPGIAKAMAMQWGSLLRTEVESND